MKVLTHNMLRSPIKGVKIDTFLTIEVTKTEEVEAEFNSEFIVNLLPKLDWNLLLQASQNLGKQEGIPKERPESIQENEDLQKALHHLLLEIDILEGNLVCMETQRKFPIKNGIPNMLLNEDEV